MKTFGYYILTWATLGQFAFVWLYLMIKQSKLFSKELNIDLITFLCLYAVYIAACVSIILQDMSGEKPFIFENPIVFWGLAAVAAYMVWLTVKWLIKVANYVRSQSIQMPNNAVLVFLFLFYALAFPLLQSKLNTVYEKNA